MPRTRSADFHLLSQPMAITGKSPVWDARRDCLWWVDIQAQRLLKTLETGQTEAIPVPSQPGFVALADSGRLVLGLEDGLWALTPETGAWERLSDTEADRPTVRLNDGRPDSRGRLWFGSMDMTHSGKAIGKLYRRDVSGRVEAVREGITIPNAITPCGHGRGLLFVDSPTKRIEMLEIEPADGALTGAREVLRIPGAGVPDGACMDAEGNFWITLVGPGKVLRFSATGRILDTRRLPVMRPTSVTIGGRDGMTLFVTNQRRFLPADELGKQPEAGGLHMARLSSNGSVVHTVGGL